MFVDRTDRLLENLLQLHFGIAVTDLDGDGNFELVVCVSNGPNQVLKWGGSGFLNIADEVLADPSCNAIAAAAGDLNGDGREELYVMNSDTFAGWKHPGDRLFAYRDGRWLDLFAQPGNLDAVNLTAGRSVAVLDRLGNGHYGFLVASYGDRLKLFELDRQGRLVDSASDAGLALLAGGRSLLCAPFTGDLPDIFVGNEGGPNFLFRNRGDGTFEELAGALGISDPVRNARGAVVLDANGDGRPDLFYGNWEGPHRLFLNRYPKLFQAQAAGDLLEPSRVRTVIVADFDNDGFEELLLHNFGQSNRLFRQRQGEWVAISCGDAEEPGGLGTGAAVGDFDGDGRLELILSHGEAAPQPLTLFHGPDNGNAWLRVLPLTLYGAPARGATVRLIGRERQQMRVIDSGSGYLCQMEPVAHFGLGPEPDVERVEICWPDGFELVVEAPAPNQLLRVAHPDLSRIY